MNSNYPTHCAQCGAVLPKDDGGHVRCWMGMVMQESGIPLSVGLCDTCRSSAAPVPTGKVRRLVGEREDAR